MFTNASSVVIGGKEVQSIVTSNGGVLYQKSSPSPSTVSSISLSSSSNILSAYHSESATLTATATDNNSNPVANATVEFFNGSTSLGTSTTNSSGVATKSYSATGVGDVSLTATSGNVSSSAVTVEDCLFYDTTELSQSSTQTGGDKSTAMGDDINLTVPNKFEVTYDFKTTINGSRLNFCKHNSVTSNPQYSMYFGTGTNGYFEYGVRSSSTSSTVESITNDSAYHSYKIARNGSSLTYYRDGSQVGTKSASWIDSYSYRFYWSYWRSGTMYIKNRKVKAV